MLLQVIPDKDVQLLRNAVDANLAVVREQTDKRMIDVFAVQHEVERQAEEDDKIQRFQRLLQNGGADVGNLIDDEFLERAGEFQRYIQNGFGQTEIDDILGDVV